VQSTVAALPEVTLWATWPYHALPFELPSGSVGSSAPRTLGMENAIFGIGSRCRPVKLRLCCPSDHVLTLTCKS
jgi:hypothetical protein